MAARTWLRVGLVFLAVAQGATGMEQLFFPKTFYDDFPTHGHPWVSMLPPYNEHLMTDVGSLTLAMVLVLSVAAISMERRMIRTALAANLMFAVPHFIFHAFHLAGIPTGDAIGQTATLAVVVVLPVALLWLSRSIESA